MEQACDEANAALPPLRSFVIPGGTPAAAHLHVCRTVCRRAERRVLAVEDANPEVVRYLNRLSDLLFILARAVNERGRGLESRCGTPERTRARPPSSSPRSRGRAPQSRASMPADPNQAP